MQNNIVPLITQLHGTTEPIVSFDMPQNILSINVTANFTLFLSALFQTSWHIKERLNHIFSDDNINRNIFLEKTTIIMFPIIVKVEKRETQRKKNAVAHNTTTFNTCIVSCTKTILEKKAIIASSSKSLSPRSNECIAH